MFEAWDEYHLINGELIGLTESLPGSGLGEVIKYVLTSPGKRVRPLILVLSSEAFGCDPKKSVNAALALELVHAASLVHDDILDCGTERRGVASAFHKYGMEAALLCGDYLISRSIGLMSGYSQAVVEAFFQHSSPHLSTMLPSLALISSSPPASARALFAARQWSLITSAQRPRVASVEWSLL